MLDFAILDVRREHSGALEMLKYLQERVDRKTYGPILSNAHRLVKARKPHHRLLVAAWGKAPPDEVHGDVVGMEEPDYT